MGTGVPKESLQSRDRPLSQSLAALPALPKGEPRTEEAPDRKTAGGFGDNILNGAGYCQGTLGSSRIHLKEAHLLL